MIKRILLTLILNIFLFNAQAQDSVNYDYGYIPDLKISVLAVEGLLDPRPYLEVAADKKFAKRQSAEFAVGILLPYSLYEDENSLFKNRNAGIKLRANIKIYDKVFLEDRQNNYWAFEAIFHYNSLKSTGWYDRFEDAYEQYMTYTRRQTAGGVAVKYGMQCYTPNRRFFIDFFGGLGVKLLNIKTFDTPEDLVLFNGDWTIGYATRGEGTYYLPYITVGLKTGIVLKK